MPTKLHQFNGELINRKIVAEDGHLHKLLAAGESDESIVTDFYILALARVPTEAELNYWRKHLSHASKSERVLILEDIVWGLLNCSEFSLNH